MNGRVCFASALVAGAVAMVGLGAPGRPVMLTPAAGDCAARRPDFTWTAAPDANQYLLSITKNGEKYLEKWTRKTIWSPRFDIPEGVYEARVIGYDGVGYGQWSGKTKFRRVFTPVVSSVNGLVRDGGNIELVAGEGIAIVPVASNNTIVITANGITSTQIVALSVTTEKIDDHAVTYDKLADDAVTGPKLADNAVSEAKLADGSVTSNKIAAGAVIGSKLADGSVTSAKLAADAVISAYLADGSVTSNKIAAGSVIGSKLADGSVTSAKLASGAVLSTSLADGSVSSNKLAANAVHPGALASGGAGSGQVLKWNGSAWAPGGLYAGYAEGPIGISPSATASGAIAIGHDNTSSASYCAAIGGRFNTVQDNSASSVILGGENNQITADSTCSVIIGGKNSQVSQQYAFASGRKAIVTNEGAFVWSDSTITGVGSWGANTVIFKANGGMRIQSDTPATANHRIQWVPGDSGWQVTSDRNMKEGFAPVDRHAALEKVAALPLTTWRYKGYGRTHIGVMAQDFYSAFPLEGATDTMIDSSDLQGASLGAIQGLHAELKAERARNDALEARVKALEAALNK